MAPDTAWLAALQDGDKVITVQHPMALKEIGIVRLTATQIIVQPHPHDGHGPAWRFDRTTGRYRQPANTIYKVSLLPYTTDAEMQLRTISAVGTVYANLGKLSREKIERLEPAECTNLLTALAQIQQLLEWL